jgi:hypothetical protein
LFAGCHGRNRLTAVRRWKSWNSATCFEMAKLNNC